MVLEDVINFWLRIAKLSKNLRHPCLVWEIGCVWWLIFCVVVYLYTWSSSLVSRMWPFWKRSTGLVTRPWPPLLMFYISRSHKSNHPTNCWFILPQKKENLKNVGSGREIRCFPTQKGGNLQKILKNFMNAQNWPSFSLQLNHLRYRCYRKGSLIKWCGQKGSVGSSHISYWNLPFQDLRIPEIWMDIPHPVTDLCKPVNHTTSKWEHLEASHRQWGKPGGNLTNDLPELHTNYSRLL